MKKVAILSCVYNGESYLAPYFESLLAQTVCDFQLIIVDDGSTDSTSDIIDRYGGLLIKKGVQFLPLHNSERRGQAFCYSRGLKLVESEFFLWLDADDMLVPNSLEKRINFMNENPSLDLCICDAYLVEYPHYDKVIRTVEKPHKENDYFQDVLRMTNVLWTPGSIFVRTSHLQSRIPQKEIFDNGIAQNIQLMLPLLYKAHYRFVGVPLYMIVSRSDSDSRRSRGYQEEASRVATHYLTTMATLARMGMIPPDELAVYSDISHNTFLGNEARCALKFGDNSTAHYYYSRLKKEYKKEFAMPNLRNKIIRRVKSAARRLLHQKSH